MSLQFATAQTNLAFQSFTQKDGLTSNFVLSILQDQQGFMWIGTENGLNRFDGQHFLSFRSDPEDEASLNDNWITEIFEDSQQNLWIGTLSGLNRLDVKSGKIERIPLLVDGQAIETSVNSIVESTAGDLWLISINKGLFKLESPKGNQGWLANYYPYPEASRKDNRHFHLLNIAHATAEDLWITHSLGIDHLHLPSQKTIHYSLPIESKFYNNDEDDLVKGLFDGDNKIYLGFGKEFYVLDISSKRPRLLPFNLPKSETPSLFNIRRSFLFADKETLLIPSYRNLTFFNIVSGLSKTVSNEKPEEVALFTSPIHALYQDQQGNYWVGTAGGGLHLGQYVERPFTLYQHNPSNAQTISKGQPRTFLEDDNGNLWVGVLNHGLDKLVQQENGLFNREKSLIPKIGSSNSITSNLIIKAIPGIDNTIWMATNDKGVMKIDTTGKVMATFIHHPKNTNTLSGNRIWGLSKGPNGYIWAGTWKNGLNRLHPQTGEVIRFLHDPNNPNSLSNNRVRCLYKDNKGFLWIGTAGGISRYDHEKKQFTNYQQDANNPHSLSDNLVWAIYEDQAGFIWVGTNTGLNRFDSTTEQFEHFFEKDGLPDNTIYGILEDDAGQLWVSTENGLARQSLDAQSSTFLPLGLAEGLPTVSFLPKADLHSTRSNQLFFGSSEGILVVRPTQLQQDTNHALLRIHEMKRFKREAKHTMAPDYFVSYKDTIITLDYQDQSVSFTIADLNHTGYQRYKYEYQLSGFNQQWRPLEENRQVSFSNLPSGNYILRTRTKNLTNTTLEAVDLLQLKVIPPWWKRWWAYLTYLLLIALAIVLSVRLYLRRQLEKKEAENLQALDAFKRKLFSNIAHELRTPLTLILGPLERLLNNSLNFSNKEYTYLHVIKRNANKLLKRTNEIMELNRLEAKKGQINLESINLYDYLKIILGSFESIAPQKQIIFSFDFQLKKTVQILIDKDKFEHIIYNYLSNAFKYTPKNGLVKVVITEEANKLLLEVKDTGEGIRNEDLPNLFNRFFQTADAQKAGSSGVGLALCKEIAEFLNGRVWAESELDQGSSFFFEMPYVEYVGIIEKNEPKELLDAPPSISYLPTLMNKDTSFSNQTTILIVEDNPELRVYIQNVLAEYYQVATAKNGQDALDWLSKNLKPSLIISDIMMPVMDGMEFLDRIKKSDIYRHLPMIMLTARLNMGTKLYALQLGIDDYITKPFHEPELLIRINNLLSNQAARQAFIQDEEVKGTTANERPEEETQMSKSDQKWLKELEELIILNLDNSQFTVSSYAYSMNISERQLQRRIKKLTGLNLVKFIRVARLDKARTLLENGVVATVSEAAYQVGFETPAYFSKLFYEAYGKRPTEYVTS